LRIRNPRRLLVSCLSPAAHSRDAYLAIELVLILPIFLIFLFDMIEFSLVLTARQQLLSASRAGARIAAQGGNQDEIVAEVRRTLGRGRLADAEVDVFRGREDVLREDRDSDDDSEQDDRRFWRPSRERVAVTAHVPVTHIIPDSLAWVGLSFRHHQLKATTVLNVE
jgi:hypothetical protein